MHNSRGFIELRTIIALIVTISLLPLAVDVISYCANLKFEYEYVNDEISLYQLRRILLISYDLNNNGYSLDFIYHNEDYSLNLLNNRLVLQPGYQMYLDNVDYLEFIEEGNTLFVHYVKNDEEYKTPIAKTNGIYLADFSNPDDEFDSDNDGDE